MTSEELYEIVRQVLPVVIAAKIEGIKRAKEVLLNSPQSLWTAQTDLLDAEISKLEKQHENR